MYPIELIFWLLSLSVILHGIIPYSNCSDSNEYDKLQEEVTVDEVQGAVVEGDTLGRFEIEEETGDRQHNAVNNENSKWPNGIVYYQISPLFTCLERCVIYEAMREIEMKSCISFVEDYFRRRRTNVTAIIRNKPKSHVGFAAKFQKLQLIDCFDTIGIPLHELMHTLGFLHEHVRNDRDNFIGLYRGNIMESKMNNFHIQNGSNVTMLKLPYDLNSIMHYGTNVSTTNGQETFHVVRTHNGTVDQQRGLSDLDVRKLNKYYQCDQSHVGCLDKHPNCKDSVGWENRCRSRNLGFSNGCRKSCNLCTHNKDIDEQLSCSDPVERCKVFTKDMKECGLKMKSDMHKECYKSCQPCPKKHKTYYFV